MTYRTFGGKKVYKICPKCRTENNPHIQTAKHGLLYNWQNEISVLLMVVATTFNSRNHSVFIGKLIGSAVPLSLFYLFYLGRLKKCHVCYTTAYKKEDEFCHNCGTKYTTNVMKSFFNACQKLF
jgi:hypothetical protein